MRSVTKVLTQVATHANTIADTFRAAFAKTPLGDYAVEMTAPDDSTKGGRLALQHIRLRPPSGMALVVGTVNAIESVAELRGFAHVREVHEQRFKCDPPFDEQAYRDFLERADPVLAAFGLSVSVVDAAPSAPVEVATREGDVEAPRSRWPLLAVVFLVLATLAGIALMAR